MLRVAAVPGQRCDAAGRVTRNDFCAQWPQRDGKLTLEDGTVAGSVLTMDQAVKYTVDHFHQPLTEALRMASLDRDRGRIAPRFVADMVLLDEDLSVRRVWIAGVRPASAGNVDIAIASRWEVTMCAFRDRCH
jgi:hypothetical protein